MKCRYSLALSFPLDTQVLPKFNLAMGSNDGLRGDIDLSGAFTGTDAWLLLSLSIVTRIGLHIISAPFLVTLHHYLEIVNTANSIHNGVV